MNQDSVLSFKKALLAISQERERTNLLKKYEQNAIAFLVQRIPSWVSSDMLTGVGFAGNVIVAASFVLGAHVSRYCLLIGILGFMISWFGDSLDGRIAYYRNSPRKWHGFSLDLMIDWSGIVLIGLGYMLYTDGFPRLLGYIAITLYGLEIIIALLRYKISGQYSIDSGLLGPTEARILISVLLVLEVLFKGVIVYMTGAVVVILFFSNILEFKKVLKMADKQDHDEKRNTEKK